MAVTINASSRPVEGIAADVLAVPVFADRELVGAGAALRSVLTQAAPLLDHAGFTGQAGEAALVASVEAVAAKAVLLVGVGPREDLTVDAVRRAAAVVARRSSKARTVVTTLAEVVPRGVEPETVAQAVAEGVLLGGYQFLEYKTKREASTLRKVVVTGGAAVGRGLSRGAALAGANIWARDMENEPAGALSPAEFAGRARRLLRGKGVTVTVLTDAQMVRERLGGVIGVGQGSERPPRLVKVEYSPAGATGHVALIGKGVVFDSGGISIKPAAGMEAMKTDMSGAAAVLAAMSVLDELKVTTRVTAYAPMVENMPSGTAIRPGDVLRIRNGKTVEVLNTDAEGRLILADALSLASEDKVDAIVDVATLTGACMVALGDKIAGLMGNDDGWVGQVQAAADRAGEAMWHLPLPGEYRKLLESEIADLRNVSTGGYGGALTAGLFLQEFVDGPKWAHIDIAGPARANADDGYLVKGATGFATRTLVELVQSYQGTAATDNGRSSARTAGRKATPKRATRRPAAPRGAGRTGRTPR